METIITNARLVLEDEVVDGTVAFDATGLRAVDRGRSRVPAAIDAEGDYLAPGLIEIHTDNIERHFAPRPLVYWPDPLAAALGHDVQVAVSGLRADLVRFRFLGRTPLVWQVVAAGRTVLA